MNLKEKTNAMTELNAIVERLSQSSEEELIKQASVSREKAEIESQTEALKTVLSELKAKNQALEQKLEEHRVQSAELESQNVELKDDISKQQQRFESLSTLSSLLLCSSIDELDEGYRNQTDQNKQLQETAVANQEQINSLLEQKSALDSALETQDKK